MIFVSRYKGLVLVVRPAGKGDAGKSIEFVDGMYETKSAQEAKIIKEHPEFGLTIFADQE